jgi:hypothetical protein
MCAAFGLRAMNVNIEELVDNEGCGTTPLFVCKYIICVNTGSEYFKYMRKKALEKAVNKARIDVAEQVKNHTIIFVSFTPNYFIIKIIN